MALVSKSFDRAIQFVWTGKAWLPLIKVAIVSPNLRRLDLALLFDTGSDQLLLHPDWETFFPPASLKPKDFTGIGGTALGKNTRGQIILFGRTITCDIGFGPKGMEAPDPPMAGIIGRECFKTFGFGFWEAAHELYVKLRP